MDTAAREGGGELVGIARGVAVQLGKCYALGCCNNPRCTSLARVGEMGLVGASSRAKGLCTGCRRGYFCSKACKEEAWPVHKPICRFFKAPTGSS
jgi:hypothetical protein